MEGSLPRREAAEYAYRCRLLPCRKWGLARLLPSPHPRISEGASRLSVQKRQLIIIIQAGFDLDQDAPQKKKGDGTAAPPWVIQLASIILAIQRR